MVEGSFGRHPMAGGLGGWRLGLVSLWSASQGKNEPRDAWMEVARLVPTTLHRMFLAVCMHNIVPKAFSSPKVL